jgi:hypothetical protein
MAGTQEPARIELSLMPSLDFVPSIRRFVTDVYERLLVGPGDASRVGIATHELLENAVRCAVDGCVNIRIDVGVGAEAALVIRVANRARPADRDRLGGIVGAMREASDPLTFYTDLMRQSAKRTDGGSGLGLARINAECDLVLGIEIDGDNVEVTAKGVVARL